MWKVRFWSAPAPQSATVFWIQHTVQVIFSLSFNHTIYYMICEICQFHHTRLAVILKTWFNLAPQNTYFFTGKELFRDIPIYENLGQLLLRPARTECT